MFYRLYFLVVVTLFSVVSCEQSIMTSRHREKRWLSFPIHGGDARVVISIYLPVNLGTLQSLGWIMSFHAQYVISDQIIYWVDKFKQRSARQINDTRSDNIMPAMRLVKKFNRFDNDVEGDDSRQMLYLMIESVMFRHRKNGASCMLRTICNIAESPLPKGNGLLGEVINLIFMPNKMEKVDQKYHDAYEAGKWGADCLNLYPNCPFGDGIFDKILFQ